jgi:NAD(P)-dependent dehydrogenase (short-subunit alcohol dehydrogenase family)
MTGIIDTLAELTVVGSYSRLGFARRQPTFDPADLDVDLGGRVVVVTGATSGIGLAAARRLTTLGATVVLVGRNAAKLAAAADGILEDVKGANVCTERADLAELDDTRALADRLLQAHPAIAAVVHNAGLLVDERQHTSAGHERAFATHVLSPFLLSHRLRGALKRGAPSRLVWVSSGGMYSQHLDLRRCQALEGAYDGVAAYAQQKRAQVILSEAFAKHFADDGTTSNAMHPGWVDTPGVVSGLPAFHRLMKPWLRDVDAGADTIVWLAASPKVQADTGAFFLDRKKRRTEVVPGTHHSVVEKEALWDLCVRLTAVTDSPLL